MSTITELDILDQVVESAKPAFTPELAQVILRLRFNQAAQDRINELAEKNRQGTISEAERAVLEKYLRVGNFINLLQAKARVLLNLAKAS